MSSAQEYNARAEGTHWTRGQLPWWLRSLDAGSIQFAKEVRRYQAAHRLDTDGKLGSVTWAAIVSTERLRIDATGDFGPVHMPNAEIVPSAREERKRKHPVVGVGIHTTGSGVTVAAMKSAGSDGDINVEIERVMRNLLSQPSSYISHAYVLPNGRVLLCVPVDECAVHGGLSKERDLYAKGYDEWRWYRGVNAASIRKHENGERYAAWKREANAVGVESPLDYCDDPNGKLWAFDLVPLFNDGGEVFTDVQFEAAADLIVWASKRFGFEVGPRTVLLHRQWNPITRWPWDPGANWSWPTVRALVDARMENTSRQ